MESSKLFPKILWSEQTIVLKIWCQKTQLEISIIFSLGTRVCVCVCLCSVSPCFQNSQLNLYWGQAGPGSTVQVYRLLPDAC